MVRLQRANEMGHIESMLPKHIRGTGRYQQMATPSDRLGSDIGVPKHPTYQSRAGRQSRQL